VYLWKNVEEADPSLINEYECPWLLYQEKAFFLSQTTHSNFQSFGEVVLNEGSKQRFKVLNELSTVNLYWDQEERIGPFSWSVEFLLICRLMADTTCVLPQQMSAQGT